MIDYVFYTLACLCLIVFQTAILPQMAVVGNCYDLIIPLIIYMAFFRPVFESLVIALALGFVMDSITGGPFGIFISLYFGLCLGTRWGMLYFHSGTTVFLPFAIGVGVLIENLMLLSVTAFISSQPIFPAGVAEMMAWQIVWAVITGPMLFSFIKFLHTGLNARLEDVSIGRRNGL